MQQPDLMFPSLVEPLVETVQEEEEELAAYSEVGLPKNVFGFCNESLDSYSEVILPNYLCQESKLFSFR